MKTFWPGLCASWLLAAACQAQLPPEASSGTLMSVYVAVEGDNTLPRIVLGVEKPTLTITNFEKVARIPVFNGQSPGIAVRLKADDTKVLASVIDALAARYPQAPVSLALWFVAPGNKVLACTSARNNGRLAEEAKSGVLSFYDNGEGNFVRYLVDKVHPD